MPSLKAIRNRIASVKNSRKITRAMKLVAASKLRRAQENIVAARPYADALGRVVAELVAVAGVEAHPLFAMRPAHKAQIIVYSSDRGLAGPFNSSIIKKVELFAATDLASCSEVSLRIIGKKANQHFIRRNANIASFDPSPTAQTALGLSRETSTRIIDDFLTGKVDRVYVAYNAFRSAGSQTVTIKQVLPVEAEAAAAVAGGVTENTSPDFIYEPDKLTLLARLVPLFVQIGLYRAALESIASEFGARMMAMENATKNAGEMISSLTLVYNRARQASITKELLEIIGGAEALKG
jgi:F-type H+-transporting ATPase subunit gamma